MRRSATSSTTVKQIPRRTTCEQRFEPMGTSFRKLLSTFSRSASRQPGWASHPRFPFLEQALWSRCGPCSRRFSPVLDAGLRVDGVAFERHLSGLFFDADADKLALILRGACVPDDVVPKNEVLRFAPDPDAGGLAGDAVVLNHIVLESVPVPGHSQGFVPEIDAVLFVRADDVFAQKIVAVLVADGNAEPSVVLEQILLEQPVTDAPAEEQSVLAIAARGAVAHHRTLRTASRVKAQSRGVFARAAPHGHVVGLLKADAVAVKVSRRPVLNQGAEAAVEKDAGSAAAIERDVLLLVAVDDQVFDPRAFEIISTDDGKHGGSLGFVRHHAIGVQGPVD